MRAVKAGAVYFAVIFAAGAVLGPIRELWLIPRLGRSAGILVEAPLMIAAMVVTARWVIRRFSLATAKARLATGLVALAFLVPVEMLGAALRGLSPGDYLASFNSVFGGVSLLLFLLFAAMPMLVERRRPAAGSVKKPP